MSYYDVFVMLMDCSDDSDKWKYKRRSTVLGKHHEYKKELWEHHCEGGGCMKDPRNVAAMQDDDEVPF